MLTQHEPYTATLPEAAQTLALARRIVVFSGAGLSQASGIPTYRDTDGVWSTAENQQYSHISGYSKNPKGFARFWKTHQDALRRAKPNSGHFAIRRLQLAKPNTVVITQNVDNLLSAAGCEDVLEVHGNMHRRQCPQCQRLVRHALFGRCLQCFSVLRPDIVLFGESLPEPTVSQSFQAAKECDVMLVVGTSALVFPAAELPLMALRSGNGAKLIVVDPMPPLIASAAHYVLQGNAESALPHLIDRALALRTGRPIPR